MPHTAVGHVAEQPSPVKLGRFNSIAILDAIPNGELNTARRLCEDLRDLAPSLPKSLGIRYFRVDTPNDLESAISLLLLDAKDGLKPWLHLEGHGSKDEDGFGTANNCYCSWAYLKELITPLNIATDFNLVLVLATCFGGSFATAIRTTDPAPVLGLIGPTREISLGQVEVDFPAFYRTFLQTESLKDAIPALTARSPRGLYYTTTAEQFFYEVWASYKRNECSEEQIAKRARLLYRQAKAGNLSSPRASVGHFKRLIRNGEQTQFEKYRDTYFMYDLNPDNRARFPVTYKKAEALA